MDAQPDQPAQPDPPGPAERPGQPEVVHCDNHVLVVVKPAGLPVVPDASGDPSLLEWAREWVRVEYAKPGEVFLGVVHRLDRPVSGLVAFGRTSKGASRLSAAWRDGQVEKHYLGFSRQGGSTVGEHGVVEQWLLKDRERNRVRVLAPPASGSARPHTDARWARTRWRVVEAQPGATRLELEALSGRAHQLRVACASLGLPLAGDLKYGATESLADRRIGLHAERLSFPHPTRDERLEFHSPAPF